MGAAHGGERERGVPGEDGLRLALALGVVVLQIGLVVPGQVRADRPGGRVHAFLRHRGVPRDGRQGGGSRIVDLDGGRHDVPPGAAGEGADGDRGLHRGVADLVDDHVEGARTEGGGEGGPVVAVDDEVLDAGRRQGGAAVDDRHPVSGGMCPLDQELSEVAASADDADPLHAPILET